MSGREKQKGDKLKTVLAEYNTSPEVQEKLKVLLSCLIDYPGDLSPI